jgi:type II secretory pathway predicted ATPase ExeA
VFSYLPGGWGIFVRINLNRFHTIMLETRKDSEGIGISPFQEEVVLENYFAGADRGEVLSQMKEAMQNGVVLMVLTGVEGSGKTMLCRMLEHEASPFCKTVFFSQAVDSFEEVVRVIGRGLSLDAVDEMHGGSIDRTLEQITSFLLDEPVYLLVIFDEAENIFLATLERIRKMLDRINESGARMHILFSGRETFLENCDQLCICDFQSADELHLALTPLSEAETADYLEDCASRMTGLDVAEVFTDEVVSNIYELAKGNFKMTNILGEESAKIHGDDTSFIVLLDSVNEGVDGKGKTFDGERYLNLLKALSAHLPWIGGAAFCLLSLLFLFSLKDDEKNVGRDNRSEQFETVMEVRRANVTVLNDEKKESMMEETAVQELEKNTSGEEVMAMAPVPISSLQYIDRLPGEVEHNPVVPAEVVEKGESETAGEGLERVVVEAEEIATPPEEVQEEVETVALLRPVQDIQALKKKPGSSSESPELPLRIIKDQSRTKIHKAIVSKSNFTGDKLYNERLSAGLGWERGAKDGMYTVQLMALASKTAEKNLKNMLAQNNYRQEAGNFYILKKSAASDNIFVFYGEYPSIERARLVTNSLPKFLRDHKPYVLSIKGAIAKIRN